MRKLIVTIFIFLLPLLVIAQENCDLRVMSFNIERGDLGVKHGRGWDVRKDACLKMFQTRRPTVFGLQECNSQQRDDIKAALPGYDRVGLSVDGDTLDHTVSANPIFYNTESVDLLKWGTFWFAETPDEPGVHTWQAKKPRNATWGIFLHKPTGKEFIYFNAHIQNGNDAVANRTMSIQLILKKMKELNPDNLPCLLTGDLNSLGIESYYRPLDQFMQEAAEGCRVSDRGSTLSSYGASSSKGRRIDHLYYRGFEGLEFAVDRDTYEGVQYISDHYPVYADLNFASVTDSSPTPWAYVDIDENDPRLKVCCYHLPASVTSNSAALAQLLLDEDITVMGVQGLTKDMESAISKSLRSLTGGRYKLLSFYSDPMNIKKSTAVGYIYDMTRLSLSQFNGFWFSEKYKEQNPIWGGEEYNAGLTAVFEDKVTHKNISLITGALPEEKEANKQAALLLRKIDKEYNSERVPSFILLDYNAGYKSHSFMSTQNYWCDTYALQRALRDPMIATKTSDRPEHQSSRSDIVGLAHFVQNNAIVLSHKVLRTESSMSIHFPVIAEFVIK